MPAPTTEGPFRRVMLKLSGEVFGGGPVGVDPDVVAGIAAEIAEVVYAAAPRSRSSSAAATSSAATSCSQRGMDRDRADYMGMLGTVLELPRAAGLPGEGGRAHTGADRHRHGPGRRALHPAPRRTAPGEGPRGHLRGGRRHAVLLHRHRRRAAGAGDRLPDAVHGQERCGRRVRRRSPQGPDGHAVRHHQLPGRRAAGACRWRTSPRSSCAATTTCRSRCSGCSPATSRARCCGERIGTLVGA